VPPPGAPDDDDSAKALFYIADDYVRLRERLGGLGKRRRTRISALPVAPDDQQRAVLSASANQLRVACKPSLLPGQNGKVDTYFGHALYGLHVSGPQWRITAKRVMLDMTCSIRARSASCSDALRT